MNRQYEDIVREFYVELRPKFLRVLLVKYPTMRLEDAEDLYQDTFIAVKNNVDKGKVRAETSWESYVIRIGLNLANKKMRIIGKMDYIDNYKTSSAKSNIDKLHLDDSDDNMEMMAMLGNELERTPERCCKILHYYYYANLNMEEIANEVGMKNAGSVKVTKLRCMRNLVGRMKNAVQQMGLKK